MKKSNGVVIVPAFNEEGNIGALVSEIRRAVPQMDIIIINDHSSDGTSNTAKKLGIKVIDLPCNLGYGGAVQTGFKYASRNNYDFCIQLDGDGQHDPRCIKSLVEELQLNGTDVVLGSRFLGEVSYRIPVARRIGMSLFSRIIKFLTGMNITDPTSGYQAMNSRVIKFFADDNYPIDYPDADTLIVLNYSGFKVKEVPVIMRQRVHGESMHNNLRAVYYVFKMFLTLFIILLRGKTYYLRRNRF